MRIIKFLKNGFFFRFAQDQIAPATFWHDPNNETAYQKSSSFLAVINNENQINSNYIENLVNLRKLVLVKYIEDKSIVPNESTHFGYLQNGTLLQMEETQIFINDKLGLKALMERGDLALLESPGGHLDLHPNWFVENIIPFLED